MPQQGKHLKCGPNGDYTDEDLALFARLRPRRERCQPDKCIGGEKCWVEKGPLAINSHSVCLGCGGAPKLLPVADNWPRQP